ncbi:MAG: PAS domain S-box protein [candidate division Zixibacteria bacterium]|nr:PAS domain S-box protein [candidate division Zixibacteria bacterium]
MSSTSPELAWGLIIGSVVFFAMALAIIGAIIVYNSKIRESERKFRLLFDRVSDALLVMDKEGKINDVNESACNLLGYDKDELLSLSFFDLNPHKNGSNLHSVFKETLTRDTYYVNEATFISNPGKKISVEGGMVRLKIDKELIVLGSFRDITERIETEKALRRSEDRYSMATAATKVGVWDWNPVSGEIFIDPSIKAILGYSDTEIPNDFDIWSKLIVEEDREILLKNIEDHLKGKTIEFEYEYRMMHKDGSLRWILIKGTSIRDLQGRTSRMVGTMSDITERKEAENALKDSETEYRNLFENLQDMFYRADMHGNLLLVSPSVSKITGYSMDELLGKNLVRDFYVEPSHRDELLEKIRKDGHVYGFETALRKKDGSHFWVSVNSHIYKDKEGNVVGVEGIARDITEQKEAEKEISKFKTISDNANYGTSITDLNGNLLYVNRFFAQMHGYEPDDLINKNISTLYSEEQLPIIWRMLERMKSEGSFDVEEVWHIHRNGKKFPTLTNGVVLNDNGAPALLVITTIDITERKKAEEAIRESEERYRTLVENAQQPIFIVDRQGGFRMINKAAATYAGDSAETLVGKTMWDLFPDEIAEKQMNAIRTVIDTRRGIRTEDTTQLRGETKWFNTSIQPIISDNGSVSAQLIATDITEQKTADIHNNARIQLLEDLRSAKSIDECLTIGCKALSDARLFQRSVMTIHTAERKIIHLGHFGLPEDIVEAARNAPAPDPDLSQKMTQERFRISNSYFVPEEAGLPLTQTARYIAPETEGNSEKAQWQPGDELFIPLRSPTGKIEGWLSVDTPYSGNRPTRDIVLYIEEIMNIVAGKIREIRSVQNLEREREELEKKNIALNEILTNIDAQKTEIKRQVADNINEMLMPFLRRIANPDGSVNQQALTVLRGGLEDLAQTSTDFVHRFSKLTPREIEICNCIRRGFSSKEIAEELTISPATVHKYRELIRKKLGLTRKGVNLRTFLKNLK